MQAVYSLSWYANLINKNLFQTNVLTYLKKKVPLLGNILYTTILLTHMKSKILPLLFFFTTCHIFSAAATDSVGAPVVEEQENQSDTYIPLVQNYPSFTVEFLGMDYLYNLDPKLSVKFHNMKKFDWSGLFRGNGAILYAIRLNQSRFAFCPGIGWSTLYYAFAGREDSGSDHGRIYPKLKRASESRTECEDIKHKQGRAVLGSALKIPFIDCLLRFRFNSVLEDPKAGFHAWLGVKFGFRRRPSMIINYRAYNDSGASSVDNGHFNLRRYALGIQAGVGYSRFGLIGGFHLTPLFEAGQGPSHSDALRPFSIGLYIDLI